MTRDGVLPSAVNDLATTNLKNMSSTSVHSTATMRYWMKRTTNAIVGIDRKELVQVALLQIQGGDGAYLLVLLGSLIGVSSVHFRLICSVRYTIFFVSHELLRGWAVGVVFLCQLIHLDALLLNPASFELRITICWISLWATKCFFL